MLIIFLIIMIVFYLIISCGIGISAGTSWFCSCSFSCFSLRYSCMSLTVLIIMTSIPAKIAGQSEKWISWISHNSLLMMSDTLMILMLSVNVIRIVKLPVTITGMKPQIPLVFIMIPSVTSVMHMMNMRVVFIILFVILLLVVMRFLMIMIKCVIEPT